VVLESPGSVTLELLFSRQKYYKVNEKIARGYMQQILTSLKALHGCLIVHRNVNMSSFYLTAGGQVVLGRLESSAKHVLTPNCCAATDLTLEDPELARSGEVSISTLNERHYLAPELLLGQNHHNFSSDIWASGCILFRLLTGYHPFLEDSAISVLFRIFKTLGTPAPSVLECPSFLEHCPLFAQSAFHSNLPRWSKPLDFAQMMPPCTSPAAVDLVTRMLQMEPTRRLSAEQALMHPFFSQH